MAYETTQELLKKISTKPEDDSAYTQFYRGFLAGASAEIAGGLFYVPTDTIAQRLQIQSITGFCHNKRLYDGPIDVIRKTFKSDGLIGFYRGYFAYISAYAPGAAVQWGCYEMCKRFVFNGITYLESQTPMPIIPYGKETLVNIGSAGFASTLATIFNNPLEIMRIRTQLLESKSRCDNVDIRGGYLRLGAKILREEGWRAFYRGVKVRLIVMVPSAMVALSGYETVKVWSTDNKV